jgi:pimeloyl-ACP methyl ester carboxylesterase
MAVTTTILAAATVVFVHGAWADGSSWSKVILRLQQKGIETLSVQNPLTSLADDVAAVNRALDGISGSVVLVGHSWGGAVISQAGGDSKVSALVYVAAFAPDVGLSVNDLGKGAPPTPGLKEVVASKAGFLTITKKGIQEDFAQDLPKTESAVLAATQGPTAAKAFDDKLTVAAWHNKPTWYVVSKSDRMIDPNGERAMAKAMNAHVTEVEASHVSMLSKPDAITAVILDAIRSLPKSNAAN